MIEVREATKIVEESILKLPKILIPLQKSLGRILRQRVVADADFPPFDRVMMDGIAIKFTDFENGLRKFHLKGVQAAGSPQMTLESSGDCLEVMTGAVNPLGLDVVVPYEEVEIDAENQIATIQLEELIKGKNIHRRGTDKKKGDLLISEGVVIGTPEIAVAASVGIDKLLVTKKPSVAIISSGNELVDIHEKPLPHQIRRSNVYMLEAELKEFGIKADLFHFSDDKKTLNAALEKVLNANDLIILSGGVSKGKFDFIPEVLQELGVKQMFHRIKQKPGKPFWFGVKDNKKVVFAFPGNPVSTFLCYHKYLVPWLKKSLGYVSFPSRKAILAIDFTVKTSLTYFLQVQTTIDERGHLVAHPVVGRGSGDHANLLSSNGFLELPGEIENYKKGEVFDLISFRNINF